MSFFNILLVVLEALLALGGLLMLVLELLIERGKPAVEKDWPAALTRFWNGGGAGALGLGYVMIGLALMLEDSQKWFPVLFTPFAVLAGLGLLIHLIASMKAEKPETTPEARVRWVQMAETSGAIATRCMCVALAVSGYYWVTNVDRRMEEMQARIQTLEKQTKGQE